MNFGHEWVDVYQLSLKFGAWSYRLANPDVSQIREAMRGKAERDPRRERARARDQADRSDNTASRACRFEVSAEHHR